MRVLTRLSFGIFQQEAPGEKISAGRILPPLNQTGTCQGIKTRPLLDSVVSKASLQMPSAGPCCCLLSKSRQDPWQQLALGIITGYDYAEQRLQHLSEAVVNQGRKTLLF